MQNHPPSLAPSGASPACVVGSNHDNRVQNHPPSLTPSGASSAYVVGSNHDNRMQNHPPSLAPLEASLPYVLGSNHKSGWAAMGDTVKNFDKEKIDGHKDDIDTLLVVAGLFSAVLTAFLIESQKELKEDRISVLTQSVQQLVNQTASYTIQPTGGMLNTTATSTAAPSPPFQPSTNAIRVNVLWFSSLVLSLITASLGILVKQWLREHLTFDLPSPRAQLRIRHLREPALTKWQVLEIAATLPILLQIALGLFFVGLCYYTSSIHETVGHTTVPLVVGWVLFIFTTSALPIFFPQCSYKNNVLKWIIRGFYRHANRLASAWARRLSGRYRLSRGFKTGLEKFSRFAATVDEGAVARKDNVDLSILESVDIIQANDELLATTISRAVSEARPPWTEVVHFVVHTLDHRLLSVSRKGIMKQTGPHDRLLQVLPLVTKRSRDAVTRILVDCMYGETLEDEGSGHPTPVPSDIEGQQIIARGEEPAAALTILMWPCLQYPSHHVSTETKKVISACLDSRGAQICKNLLASMRPRGTIDIMKLCAVLQYLTRVVEIVDIDLSIAIECFDTIIGECITADPAHPFSYLDHISSDIAPTSPRGEIGEAPPHTATAHSPLANLSSTQVPNADPGTQASQSPPISTSDPPTTTPEVPHVDAGSSSQMQEVSLYDSSARSPQTQEVLAVNTAAPVSQTSPNSSIDHSSREKMLDLLQKDLSNGADNLLPLRIAEYLLKSAKNVVTRDTSHFSSDRLAKVLSSAITTIFYITHEPSTFLIDDFHDVLKGLFSRRRSTRIFIKAILELDHKYTAAPIMRYSIFGRLMEARDGCPPYDWTKSMGYIMEGLDALARSPYNTHPSRTALALPTSVSTTQALKLCQTFVWMTNVDVVQRLGHSESVKRVLRAARQLIERSTYTLHSEETTDPQSVLAELCLDHIQLEDTHVSPYASRELFVQWEQGVSDQSIFFNHKLVRLLRKYYQGEKNHWVSRRLARLNAVLSRTAKTFYMRLHHEEKRFYETIYSSKAPSNAYLAPFTLMYQGPTLGPRTQFDNDEQLQPKTDSDVVAFTNILNRFAQPNVIAISLGVSETSKNTNPAVNLSHWIFDVHTFQGDPRSAKEPTTGSSSSPQNFNEILARFLVNAEPPQHDVSMNTPQQPTSYIFHLPQDTLVRVLQGLQQLIKDLTHSLSVHKPPVVSATLLLIYEEDPHRAAKCFENEKEWPAEHGQAQAEDSDENLIEDNKSDHNRHDPKHEGEDPYDDYADVDDYDEDADEKEFYILKNPKSRPFAVKLADFVLRKEMGGVSHSGEEGVTGVTAGLKAVSEALDNRMSKIRGFST